MRTVRDLVLCSWRRHEYIWAITSRYRLHDQLIARISRRLRLCYSTRDDATVCGLRRLRLTVRRVADTVRDAIATITARHDCATRNRNENTCFFRTVAKCGGKSTQVKRSWAELGAGARDCDGRGTALDSDKKRNVQGDDHYAEDEQWIASATVESWQLAAGWDWGQ